MKSLSLLNAIICASASTLAAFVLVVDVAAQEPNTEFRIASITPDLVKTPEYSVTYGPQNKRVPKYKDFIELEVSFDWQPKAKEPAFVDDLTINYFVLLNDKSRANPDGTLLIGSVNHTAVLQGQDLKSVMYISPRTLERFFEGKPPTTVNGAVFDVGVTITKQGQLVAEDSWKGEGQWWSSMQQVGGYVLNKSETPFAPLLWDYYEPIKARGPGL